MRSELAKKRALPWRKRWSMKLLARVLGSSRLYRAAGRLARWLLPRLPRFLIYHRWNPWGRARELPDWPKQSFREMYRERHERQPPSDT